jgi:hypothetical protein
MYKYHSYPKYHADVGPVNLWMHSLFNDVSVSLNENLISAPTSLYPYSAYIEILLFDFIVVGIGH